jgi:hypothetical protein
VSEADELRASRARRAAAALAERRRVERSLHDGVQQDLIAMAVRLQLVRELAGTDLPAALSLLEEVRVETHEALDRVRALASDIYPSLLDARGLADALREAARVAAVPAQVEAPDLVRHPPEIEAAAFFFCRSALDGAGADAKPTIAAHVDDGKLHLEIAGVESWNATPARDIVEAVGGTVTLGQDGRVTATIPVG